MFIHFYSFTLFQVDELALALCHHLSKQMHLFNDCSSVDKGILELLKHYQVMFIILLTCDHLFIYLLFDYNIKLLCYRKFGINFADGRKTILFVPERDRISPGSLRNPEKHKSSIEVELDHF